MTTHEAIIVPVRVTALMVNQDVTLRDWHRWYPDFSKEPHLSPVPDPVAAKKLPPDQGVLVHWELPASLRRGVLGDDGITTYPAAPNRWLVVRYSGGKDSRCKPGGRTAAGWLVQSDCLRDSVTDEHDNSAYAVAKSQNDPTPVRKRIGRVLPLTGDLSEPAATAALTAIGPGLPTFAVYQPYNQGVFSLYDSRAALGDTDQDLSYLVMGWFSADDKDPFADITADLPARFAERFDRLGWDCPLPGTTARTLYTGAVTGLVWQQDAAPAGDFDEAPPDADRPKDRVVTFGVGESSADGVCALAHDHQPAVWDADNLRKLQALQYGLLQQLGTHDGAVAAQLRTREARFDPVAGGFVWDFTTPSSTPGDPVVPVRPLPEEERQWLAATNKAQREHDRALRNLVRRQERLYELWWYRQQLNDLIPDDGTQLDAHLNALLRSVDTKLDKTINGTLANKVDADRKTLAAAPPLLRATTPDELKKAIDDEVARLTALWKRPPAGRPTRTPRPA
ncbi:hypothetical protein E1287_40360, partial [Actinomadura sp. KC06]|uniref:hypothetical protein n=1 Tax=Actinomadura sp. KC06 TaxID=2530369 RepID=UPI0010EBC0A8